MEEQIILVDRNDRAVGVGEKIKVHREGNLHRAFSIFIFNSEEKLLLQKRAETKYHSGGLWTNTCCSHPRWGESLENATHRRLQEEMGFDCHMQAIFSFTYHAQLDNQLIEHEYDHVFIGRYDGAPAPNPEEVEAWKWIDIEALHTEMSDNPQHYTYWLKIALGKIRCLDRLW